MNSQSPFHCKWKGERWSFRKPYCFWGFICVWIFCLISLVSSFAKEETRETRRKEKKEERLPRSRLPFDKIPGVWRGEFYLLLCVTCGFSTYANSAGPNHSLRIRWSVEMVGGNRSSTSYPVGVGASTTRKNERVWNASHQVTNKRSQCRGDHKRASSPSSVKTNDFIWPGRGGYHPPAHSQMIFLWLTTYHSTPLFAKKKTKNFDNSSPFYT